MKSEYLLNRFEYLFSKPNTQIFKGHTDTISNMIENYLKYTLTSDKDPKVLSFYREMIEKVVSSTFIEV